MSRICPTSKVVHLSKTSILIPFLVGMLLVATGCTSTHRVSERGDGYSRITEKVTGETVQVFLRDGRTMKLRNLYVGANSTRGMRPNGGSRHFPTSALRKIEIVDRGTGFWQGAGIGLGTGLGATLVVVGTEESDFGQAIALVGGLVVSIPLTLIGGGIGAAKGQKEVYRFPKRSPSWNGTTTSSGRRTETVRRPEE